MTDRRGWILGELSRAPSTCGELAALADVSYETIHVRLTALLREGRVRREARRFRAGVRSAFVYNVVLA